MSLDRRAAFRNLASLGIGSTIFQRALAAQVPQETKTVTITAEMVKQAEWIAGIPLTEADRKALATVLNRNMADFSSVRGMKISHDTPPAIQFAPSGRKTTTPTLPSPVASTLGEIPAKPAKDDELAFLSVGQLGSLLRKKAVSSVELTKLYLGRLKALDPKLLCVVSLTEELAIKQAKKADEDLAAGKDHGPLHGIPWGAKDLISVAGYKTTWGAGHFKEQTLNATATVAKKLEQAGAVLIAKLTLGALAMGDVWFGGMTRNPWNTEQGSSGSSAGSSSATVAGCVGFAIGSETLGSIVSPCTRCGATGLRPSFGRVSRAGCMTLSWSMDKLGPIARSIDDCALVFGAIHGADPLDPTTVDRPFTWPAKKKLSDIRVGHFESTTEEELNILKTLGVKLVPVKLPTKYPLRSMMVTLDVESATAFDDLALQGVHDGIGNWGATFRKGQMISAVQYLQVQRLRTLLMRDMDEVFEKIDCYVGGNDLLITNLTGHPTAVMPSGFRKNGTPNAITFTGAIDNESDLLAVADAYQKQTGHHLKRPQLG